MRLPFNSSDGQNWIASAARNRFSGAAVSRRRRYGLTNDRADCRLRQLTALLAAVPLTNDGARPERSTRAAELRSSLAASKLN